MMGCEEWIVHRNVSAFVRLIIYRQDHWSFLPVEGNRNDKMTLLTVMADVPALATRTTLYPSRKAAGLKA